MMIKFFSPGTVYPNKTSHPDTEWLVRNEAPGWSCASTSTKFKQFWEFQTVPTQSASDRARSARIRQNRNDLRKEGIRTGPQSSFRVLFRIRSDRLSEALKRGSWSFKKFRKAISSGLSKSFGLGSADMGWEDASSVRGELDSASGMGIPTTLLLLTRVLLVLRSFIVLRFCVIDSTSGVLLPQYESQYCRSQTLPAVVRTAGKAWGFGWAKMTFADIMDAFTETNLSGGR